MSYSSARSSRLNFPAESGAELNHRNRFCFVFYFRSCIYSPWKTNVSNLLQEEDGRLNGEAVDLANIEADVITSWLHRSTLVYK